MKEDQPTRRSLLKAMAALIVDNRTSIISGAAKAVGSGLIVTASGEAILLYHSLVPPPPDPLDRKSFEKGRRLLLGDGLRCRVIPSCRDGIPTKPSLDAASSLITALDVDQNCIFPAGNLTPQDHSGNLLLLGGPVANAHVLALMGKNGASQIFKDKHNRPMRFDYRFDLATSLGDYRSEVIGSFAPNWELRVGDTTPLRPNLHNGKAVDDFVLITSIPNVFDVASLVAGERIIMFSGTHGAGTRAIDLLLRDSNTLETLGNQASGTTNKGGWQTIIKVLNVGENYRGREIDYDQRKFKKLDHPSFENVAENYAINLKHHG